MYIFWRFMALRTTHTIWTILNLSYRPHIPLLFNNIEIFNHLFDDWIPRQNVLKFSTLWLTVIIYSNKLNHLPCTKYKDPLFVWKEMKKWQLNFFTTNSWYCCAYKILLNPSAILIWELKDKPISKCNVDNILIWKFKIL